MTKKNNNSDSNNKIDLTAEFERLKKELENKEWVIKKTDTALKALYRELEKKNEKLEKLDQLKSEFVSVVSHELRAPLSIIKESISLVLDKTAGETNKKQTELLAIAENNTNRLARIVNNLLDISKIEAGKIELKRVFVEFSTMMKDICTRWKLESDKNHQIFQLSLPKSPVNIYVDPDKISEVMSNLISNAIKYTPEKGRIKVELKDKKNQVEVFVSDTGVGIAKENLPKVFSKFQQFSRMPGQSVKGTGLGMAIANELVKMHQGIIRVESKLNKGSRFSFSLPKMDVESVFREYINNEIKAATDNKIPLSLVIIHISKFDQLQKELGYKKAHNFLKDIEKAAKDSLRRRADIIVRSMGELILLLIDTNKKEVGAVRVRLEEAINTYLSKGREKWLREIRITVGNATYPYEAANDEELLNKARTIMHRKNRK